VACWGRSVPIAQLTLLCERGLRTLTRMSGTFSARVLRRVALLAGVGLQARCVPPRNDAQPGPVHEAESRDAGPHCPEGRRAIWRGGFDGANWLEDWDPASQILYGASNARVVRGDRFGPVLRVLYPAGSSSNSYAKEGHPVGGLEFLARLPAGGESRSVLLSYWLRFGPNFQWVRGGKLPGLCGGTCPSGGAQVSGYGGWSMRVMWRPGGAGEEYAYILPARPYGTELGLSAWKFTTGEWHHLTQELVLNTGGAPNGALRVWFDVDPTVAPTFEANNLTYRLDETPADTVLFSTFFGGHDAEWATPVDTFIEFADFVVCGEAR
jgi:hypothetical protein